MLDSFRQQYPAFDDFDDFLVEDALLEGECECGGKRWGSYVDERKNFKRRGIFLYAAHVLASSYGDDGATMLGAAQYAVSAKSVGDESVTFATGSTTSAGDAWLATTLFGQQWLRLRKRAGMGAIVV